MYVFLVRCCLASIFTISFLSLSAEEERRVVVGKTLGRLGNCFFQVAATQVYAWENNADAYFPWLSPVYVPADYKIHIFHKFNTNFPKCMPSEKFSGPNYEYIALPKNKSLIISGYLQDQKYFAKYRAEILKLFCPRKADLRYIQRKYKKLLRHPKSVAVHVRHYKGEGVPTNYFHQYGAKYYSEAMNHFSKEHVFFVFSDNVEYAKSIIDTDHRHVVFIKGEAFYIDFWLQTMCKNNIICNSSFSWWAAWLNQNAGQRVIKPRKWVGSKQINSPDHWITIDIEK